MAGSRKQGGTREIRSGLFVDALTRNGMEGETGVFKGAAAAKEGASWLTSAASTSP